ncbi:MAG: hypothetical protein ACE5E1_10730 [Phycisphaerae bacterium]
MFRAVRAAVPVSLLALPVGCATPRPTDRPVYFPPPPAAPHAVWLKSFNGLSELVTPRRTFWDILRGAAAGPTIGRPAGIAYAAGHLYLCDTEHNVVQDWDLSSGTRQWLGREGETVLQKPVDVAVDAARTVYVADTGRAEVVAFDPRGRPLRRFKPPGREAYRPVALALAGETLCAADIAAHRVDIFSLSTGEHLGEFGHIGTEPGAFYYPMGLAADARGRLYLSDMMNARVQVFGRNRGDHNGPAYRVLLSMGKAGDRYGDMGQPRHLAVGPDGVVFIADAGFSRVQLYDSSGRLLMLLGGPDDTPGGTPLPVGVAVAEDLPESIKRSVPADFRADYFLFVSNTVGEMRLSLFAIGTRR